MAANLIQKRKRIDDEPAFAESVRAQQHAGGVPARRRVARGESSGDHFRRRLLSVEKVVGITGP